PAGRRVAASPAAAGDGPAPAPVAGPPTFTQSADGRPRGTAATYPGPSVASHERREAASRPSQVVQAGPSIRGGPGGPALGEAGGETVRACRGRDAGGRMTFRRGRGARRLRSALWAFGRPPRRVPSFSRSPSPAAAGERPVRSTGMRPTGKPPTSPARSTRH